MMSEHPPLVRMSPPWMRLIDDRILEVLAHPDTADQHAPREIADSEYIFIRDSYVCQRLRLLLNVGLVSKPKHGIYEISDTGLRYLAGEEDMRDAEKLE